MWSCLLGICLAWLVLVGRVGRGEKRSQPQTSQEFILRNKREKGLQAEAVSAGFHVAVRQYNSCRRAGARSNVELL